MPTVSKKKTTKEEAEEVKWANSKAKKLLLQDLSDGTIPLDAEDMGPQTVYMQRPEFAEIPYNRFRDRLNNMRKTIRLSKMQASSDGNALAHDRVAHPKRLTNHRGERRWEGSDAEWLLKLDIENGKNDGLTPSAFWQSRSEYQEYSLLVFRKHRDQEIKRRKYIAYLKAKNKDEL